MTLTIPHNGRHSQVQVTARAVGWSYVTTVDDTHKTIDIPLPPGMEEESVEAFAHFLNGRGEVDAVAGATVIKTKKRINRGRPVR